MTTAARPESGLLVVAGTFPQTDCVMNAALSFGVELGILLTSISSIGAVQKHLRRLCVKIRGHCLAAYRLLDLLVVRK